MILSGTRRQIGETITAAAASAGKLTLAGLLVSAAALVLSFAALLIAAKASRAS